MIPPTLPDVGGFANVNSPANDSAIRELVKDDVDPYPSVN
jgi:hypothetical protein